MEIITPLWRCKLVNVEDINGVHFRNSTVCQGLWALPGGQQKTSAEVRLLVAYQEGWELKGDQLLEKKHEVAPRDPWLGWSSPIEIQPFSWQT